VGGVRLDQGEVLEDKGIDRVLVARRLVTAFLKQVLEDGFFHADPHPSNILVGDEGELIQVDFGMMGYLDKSMRQAVATLLFRIVRRDYDGIIRVFKKVGVMEGGLDERRFKLELMGLLEPYFSRTLEGMPLGTVVNQVMRLSLKYRIRFPPEFYLLGRALVLVDSNLRYLYPELNVIEVVTPFALKILRERHQPRKIVESLGEEWEGIREGIRVFPSQMLQVLQRINKGDVHLYLTHEGLEELKEVMERNSLRLSITLLLALFVVMGTWGLSSPWGWGWQVVGLPFFPLVSYGLAVGMGVFLLGFLLFKKR
jgi:ubiquinone biosynthesis protein